jgi:hypothetical protein
MRILCISPKPFGLMGTPGIYMLVEAYSKYAEVCVVTNKINEEPFKVVNYAPKTLKLVKISFSQENYLDKIAKIINDFNPDIVTVACHPKWTNVIEYLKNRYPKPKYVLDIKSPLLLDKNSKRDAAISNRGNNADKSLDLIITRTADDIPTLIPECSTPFIEYPLSVKMSDYSPKNLKYGISSCIKFVYIGSIAPLRKLERFLELVSALPMNIKEKIVFDFYGSGSSENSFRDIISKLNLDKIVYFKGCVEGSRLPGILQGYDAGIAWVPHGLYENSSSLKIIEYTAAGLLPIATNTIAHKKFAENGFHVLFFTNTETSFELAIQNAINKGFDACHRRSNLKLINKFDWEKTVAHYIFPAFSDLITNYSKQDIEFSINNNLQRRYKSREINKGLIKAPAKLLVISPRYFGMPGTAGTYLLIESYSKFLMTYAIVKKKPFDVKRVYKTKYLKNCFEIDFTKENIVKVLPGLIDKCSPDIVIIFNYISWHTIAQIIKKSCEKTKIILDIQTPLIIEDNIKLYKKVRNNGKKYSKLVDLVISFAPESIESWIPNWKGRSLIYPLGIQLNKYNPKNINKKCIYCTKFVYIGSLHPFRKIDILLKRIAGLPIKIKKKIKLDFYGNGPHSDVLLSIVKELNIEEIVSFKGLIETDELCPILSKYDAGIAWVPHEIYSASPSLKLLEYIAAGLVPLATDTIAHKREFKNGLHIEFFSDDQDTFNKSFVKTVETGFSTSKRNVNLNTIKNYDYDMITKNIILPYFNNQFGRDLNLNTLKNYIKKNAEVENINTNIINIELPHWDLPFKPKKYKPIFRSDFKIASITNTRLSMGFDLECELFHLTSDNWYFILTYLEPDILLIESSFESQNGYSQFIKRNAFKEPKYLIKIIDYAKKIGIPTIFWNTSGPASYEKHKKFSRNFDINFCTDQRQVELMRSAGIKAKTLQPAVQPAIFNPFGADKNDIIDTGILFDDSNNLTKFDEVNSVINNLVEHDINIYRHNKITYSKNILGSNTKHSSKIKGYINKSFLPDLYKNAKMYLSIDIGEDTYTEYEWISLEVAACRLHHVHFGKIKNDDLRYDLVKQFATKGELFEYINSRYRNKSEIELHRYNAWRETVLKHCYSNRLITISKEIGKSLNLTQFPKFSVIFKCNNYEKLPKIVKQFENQTYKNKELIVVTNKRLNGIEGIFEDNNYSKKIKFVSIKDNEGKKIFIESALKRANGEYTVLFDESQNYHNDYLIDIYLSAKARTFD